LERIFNLFYAKKTFYQTGWGVGFGFAFFGGDGGIREGDGGRAAGAGVRLQQLVGL
jgi:hypothetical protein